mgnify:FL=1
MDDRICIGADGCPGGWICVVSAGDGPLRAVFTPSLGDVVAHPADATVAVDMPIGLPDAEHGMEPGIRGRDRAARGLLGHPRSSSVFSAPVRELLAIDSGDIVRDHTEASRISQAVSGRKVTRQTMNILPRIREVDELLQSRPALRDRIFEVHPELSFRALQGSTVVDGKRTPAGRRCRWDLLADVFGSEALAGVEEQIRGTPARTEDLLDALACLWSADRIARGVHGTVPEPPEHDATGLRMSISW